MTIMCIMLFSKYLILGISLIVLRRNIGVFGKAELGGPMGPKFASGYFLIGLWFLFVILVSLNAHGKIPGF